MPGKHDRAGEDAPSRLLLTGPIVVRGLTRGVKDALRREDASRHRADGDGSAADDTAAEMREDQHAVEGLPPAAATAPPDQEDPPVAPDRPRNGDGDQPEHVADADADDRLEGEQEAEPTEDASRDPDDAAEDEPGGGDAEQDRREARPGDGAAALFAGLGPATSDPQRRRPGRERLSSGVIGIAVLAVLAVVCAGLIVAVVLKTRADAAVAAREAAAYTPPPLNPSAATATGPVAVIADESAQRAASGVSAAQRWPRLLAAGLDADLDLQASTGRGYASAGSSGGTFVDAAGEVPAGASVVLFVGGVADDRVSSLSLARAATEAFSAATQRAPDAAVVAVGPLFRPSDVSVADFDALRTSLRSAARIAGVRWIDPVSAGWLSSADSASALSAADERTIAKRLRAVVDDGG